LRVAPFAWAEIKAQIPESQIGSEHFVEQAESRHRIAKVTIPPDFGRTPAVRSHPAVNLRGEPGIREEIEFVPATPLVYFRAAGWTRLNDPSGHLVFYNYAYQVRAIDAAGRNCYLTDGELQPFDVILCRPGPELEEFLRIYPA
jgi:hypothetical protein